MKNPPRACALSHWLHRRPVVGEDGVYCEAVSRFPWFSLMLTDPFARAGWRSVFWTLLLLLSLCVYAGVPISTWLFSECTFPFLPSFFTTSMYMLFSPSDQTSSETPATGVPHAEGRASSTIPPSRPPRSLFREMLSMFPPTSAFGRCTFLFGLLELFTFSVLLRFILLRIFRVAAGFSHSQLEEYSRRLAGAHKLYSLQHSSLSSSPSVTPSRRKGKPEQVKGNMEAPAAATERLLEGQVAVVTGVTSGTGRETASQLAKWGAHVFFGARNIEQGRVVAAALNAEVSAASPSPPKVVSSCFNELPPERNLLYRVTCLCEHLLHKVLSTPESAPPTSSTVRMQEQARYTPRIHVHELDLCRAASVREFSRWVLNETNDQVDILVNNAGCMYLPEPTPASFAERGACFEYHMVCNHLGHFLLTQLLLPALKRSAETANRAALVNSSRIFEPGRGRIINLSSCIHALYSRGFSVLDVAFTPETAKEAAAAIASDEIARRQHVSSEEDKIWITRGLLKDRNRPAAENYNPWRAYSNSKLCNIWFTKELQRQLLDSVVAGQRNLPETLASKRRTRERSVDSVAKKGTEEHNFHLDSCVGVYAVHPGVVATNLGRVATKHSFLAYMTTLLTRALLMKTPADGAATSLFLCIAPKSMLQWGCFYADGNPTWVAPAALDKKAQRELWIVSENVCRSSASYSATPAAEKHRLAAEIS